MQISYLSFHYLQYNYSCWKGALVMKSHMFCIAKSFGILYSYLKNSLSSRFHRVPVTNQQVTKHLPTTFHIYHISISYFLIVFTSSPILYKPDWFTFHHCSIIFWSKPLLCFLPVNFCNISFYLWLVLDLLNLIPQVLYWSSIQGIMEIARPKIC